MAHRSDAFEVNNGTPLSVQLGYLARSVVVDNFTSSWLYIPSARRYVPPGGGAGLTLEGVQEGRAEWRTPPGRIPVAAIPSEVAEIIFSELSVPEGSGITTPTLINKQQNPNIGKFFRVGPGPAFVVIEPPGVGLQLYVIAGILSCTVGAALTLLVIQEWDGTIPGQTIASIGADQINSGVPWQGFGFIVKPGLGLRFAALDGACSGACSILYSK